MNAQDDQPVADEVEADEAQTAVADSAEDTDVAQDGEEEPFRLTLTAEIELQELREHDQQKHQDRYGERQHDVSGSRTSDEQHRQAHGNEHDQHLILVLSNVLGPVYGGPALSGIRGTTYGDGAAIYLST